MRIRRFLKYCVEFFLFPMPSCVRVPVWRCLGFRVGKRVRAAAFSLVMVEHLDIDDDAVIDPFTFIALLKEFKLGRRSRIVYFTKILSHGSFIAGDRCLVSGQCLIECCHGHRVVMGEYSCFGPRNTIYTHGHYLPTLQGFPCKKGDVEIGPYSWTGMLTTVLPGTVIGGGTIVAPGTVLAGRVPGGAFIRSASSRWEASPLSEKMRARGAEEVRRYVMNAVAAVTSHYRSTAGLQQEELFNDLALSPPRRFRGVPLRFFPEGGAACGADSVAIGYGLSRELRCDPSSIWIDFIDYRASGESNRAVRTMADRMYRAFGLKFLFARAGERAPGAPDG